MLYLAYGVLVVLLVSGAALENIAMLWVSIVGVFGLTLFLFFFGNNGPAPEAFSGTTSVDGSDDALTHGSGYAHGVNSGHHGSGETGSHVNGSGYAADSSGADSTGGDYGGGDGGGSDGGGAD